MRDEDTITRRADTIDVPALLSTEALILKLADLKERFAQHLARALYREAQAELEEMRDLEATRDAAEAEQHSPRDQPAP